jgi:hypothetical protein
MYGIYTLITDKAKKPWSGLGQDQKRAYPQTHECEVDKNITEYIVEPRANIHLEEHTHLFAMLVIMLENIEP